MTEEDTQYTCEPLGDLRYLFRTTNECHSNEHSPNQYTYEPLGELRHLFRTTNDCYSNEHPQNLVSGDKISQDSSKEPIQLGRDSTPKQTGDRSSDPYTRMDLSHPGV